MPATEQFERDHYAIHDAAPGTCKPCDTVRRETAAAASQARFEAMFDHVPQIDTRTPADIRNGVKR